ncbi:Uncharacterised protein [Mycobacterium tuberculosis]|nr:Uncharacterised protein [Mycobacterium tuberculosis]
MDGFAAGNPHRPADGCGQWNVEFGETPNRGALKNGEVGDNWRHLGNDLHRRGPGADDPDALAGQVLGVIPACGVHGDAFKRVHPVDVG